MLTAFLIGSAAFIGLKTSIALILVIVGVVVVIMSKAAATAELPNLEDTSEAEVFWYPMKASTTIYKGTAVGVLSSSGDAEPQADTANLNFVGIADATVANTGAAASVKVPVRPPHSVKIKTLNASSAAKTWVGQLVYWVDDNTVALAGTTTNDKVAGLVIQFISTTQVKVDLRIRSA